LSYAVELRYGILLEIAKSVKKEEPINVEMGCVNVIWQGDVCERALRALFYCNKAPELLNITGPEMISVRWLAESFGELFDKSPKLVGEEKNTALLNNAVKSNKMFGYPTVSLKEMIEWTANWVEIGGDTIHKPTHFQEREGAF